jgi:L-amino acid N-acyltransferase YncA
MDCSARPATVEEIDRWRDLYRREMNCQIVHDSIHARPGWTQPYRFEVNGSPAGYGSLLIGGPWTGTRTIFEFYVAPQFRFAVFDLFGALLAASGANAITAQTNDPLLSVMVHIWAHNVVSEKILFEDSVKTTLALEGVTLRRRGEPDNDWVLEVEGTVAAAGGVLLHYNRPYGDVYMEVTEPYRRRGLGSFLVQELKRICHEAGCIPCARCSTENVASRKTLQKAGFSPCAHILTGLL